VNLDDITPIILTCNCEANLEACLGDLGFARRIVIIDGGSTDRTLEIARAHPNVDVIHRPFDHHAAQRSFGIAQVSKGWVLCLDSDYRIDAALLAEIASLPEEGCDGYLVPYAYCIFGRPLRASLMPPRAILARAGRLRVDADGHAERFRVEGVVGTVRARIRHDDRKPLERWLQRQVFYSRMEARKLCAAPDHLRLQDRIRRTGWLAPFLVFPYLLVLRGLWRDGWAGWYYTLERTMAEVILALAVIEQRRIGRPARAD
jgi:glycosyltransferase involved in cell wall biosynthesis